MKAPLIFVLLIGVAFLVSGLWIHRVITPDGGDIVVEGVVVDVVTSSSGESSTYSPVVEYVDPESGLTYVAEGTISSSNEPSIGENRNVAFPPENPREGKVVGQVWFAWIFISLGVVITGTMTLLLLRMGSGRQKVVQPEPGPQDTIRTDSPQDEIRD